MPVGKCSYSDWILTLYCHAATCHTLRTLNKQTKVVLFSDQALGERSKQPQRNWIVSGKPLSSSTGPCRRLNNLENRTGRKQQGTNVCMRPAIHPAALATVALTRRYTKRCGVSITHKAAAASNRHTPAPKHTHGAHAICTAVSPRQSSR